MRRWLLPGIPFVLSLALSLSTAGSHCYWQDSGFFLAAVKELGILYPPGFVVYELLCKAWTVALRFVDFTYAVHLFSAFCAALAAGTIAVAARDLLRTKGPIFRTVQEESPSGEWIGISIGCLAASGYTFWAAAILAKVYAFYYLVLSLLIWRMIRADESGKPRDFTIVAALIGLAWQAHPSATNAGLALVLFVAFHRRAIGWKGIAWRAALAAVIAVGPVHLLPLIPRSGCALRMDEPAGWSGFWKYVSGSRYTTIPGVFGLDGSRVASVGRFFWEEFLGIGAALAGFGLFRLWKVNRRLLLGLALWVAPVIVVTVLFKLEGQHDFWMVAAWIPLWIAAAAGLQALPRRREAVAVLALAGTIWAVVANRSDLDQRDYALAETFGRVLLDPIGAQQTVSLESDDALSSTLYLQSVRGYKPHVYIVPVHIEREGVFGEKPPGPGVFATPAGPLFRYSGSPGPPVDLNYWGEPIRAEEIPKLFRRERGQFVERRDGQVRVRPEPYEKRLLRLLLLSRKNLAWVKSKEGRLDEAAKLYQSILSLDPWLRDDPSILAPLAVVEAGLGKLDDAEARFRKVLALRPDPEAEAQALYFMVALCAANGRNLESAEWKAKALAHPALAPELRAKLQGR